MGKILIKDIADSQPVPFLRGILTSSLQNAGLSFDDAYRISSELRQELSSGDKDRELSNRALRRLVEKRLRTGFNDEIADRYMAPVAPPATVYVHTDDGRITPFSRSVHQRYLAPCCPTIEDSEKITEKVYEHILNLGQSQISALQVCNITVNYLEQELSKQTAQNYLNWTSFSRDNQPLLVLIGGTPGCGKSTIAAELAHKMDIIRIQSTDMLREVMRMMIPERLSPVLHTSSFNAGRMLPMTEVADANTDESLIRGYQAQAELLSVACEGIIQRALQERISLILEGVHVHPALLEKTALDNGAIIVPIMLGVLKQGVLRNRLKGRGNQIPNRRGERYLEHFDTIWRLQSYLLSEADRAQIPIIQNSNKDKAIQEIMHIIIERLNHIRTPAHDKSKNS